MPASRSLFWRPLTGAPELGRDGEVIAAGVRLLAATTVVMLALGQAAVRRGDLEVLPGCLAALAFFVLAVALRRLALDDPPPGWLGPVSSIVDVGIITAYNGWFVLAGLPLTATNGRLALGIYLLAISLTALRHDPRLCLLGGSLAILGYAATVAWAVARYHLGAATPLDPVYGSFRWEHQLARLVLLALATYVNFAIVRQSARHLAASMHDVLTGLPNRRFAEQLGKQALAAAARSGRHPVLALCDVDHFKAVNDRHGHDAGDAVLVRIAGLLRQSFRSSDVVARIGGEEFLLLFPEGDAAGAMARIESFHRALPHALMPPAQPPIVVTASIGVAVYPQDGTTWPALFHEADRRLYEAKAAGRNRIVGIEHQQETAVTTPGAGA